MRCRDSVPVFAGLALALSGAQLRAQDSEPEPETPAAEVTGEPDDPGRLLLEPNELTDPAPPPPQAPPPNEFKVDLEFHLRTDLRDVEGDVWTYHTDAAYRRTFQISEDWTLRWEIGGEYSHYEFSDTGGLPGADGSAFDDLYQFGTLAVLTYRVNEQWSVYGGGFFGFGVADGAEVGDALIGGASVGFTWISSPKLVLGLGITARTLIEDDVQITPTPIVRWQFHEDARLETFTLPQGFALAVTATPVQELDVRVFAGYQYRQWRLGEYGDELDEGVFRDGIATIGAGLTWRPAPMAELSTDVGAVVYRKLEFLNDGGHEFDDIETDPYAMFRLRFILRF